MVMVLMRADQVDPTPGASRASSTLIFLAGALNGLMVWFRHDLAAYALLSVLIWFGYPLFRARGYSAQVGSLVKGVGVFALGVALTFSPLAVHLLVSAGYANLYFSLIESPATIYPAYRSLPFPGLSLSRLFASSGVRLVYFPFTILALSVIFFGVSMWRTGSRRPASKAISGKEDPRDKVSQKSPEAMEPGLNDARLGLLLFSLVALFSMKGLIRPQALHFAPAIVFSLILAAYLSRRQKGKWVAPLAVLLVVVFAPTALTAVKTSVWNIPQFIAACQHPTNPTLVCVRADRDTPEAARFIATEFPAAQKLFVGTGAHDRIFVGNVAAYFLVPKPPATKWHESHPGIQTRADIQREIIAELRSTESLVVLVDRRWDKAREPNRSAKSSGNTDLDRFLADSFRLVKAFGPIAIYTSKQAE